MRFVSFLIFLISFILLFVFWPLGLIGIAVAMFLFLVGTISAGSNKIARSVNRQTKALLAEQRGEEYQEPDAAKDSANIIKNDFGKMAGFFTNSPTLKKIFGKKE
jgi:hypothetical protein